MNDKPDNLYQPAVMKTDNAFNSAKQFADNSWEVTREQRLQAQQRNAALIQQTKKAINECC